jgi:LPXTG-motif cell wall-anchored protein
MTMVSIHAASLWSGLLVLLLITLSVLTVRRRRRHLVAFGDGGNDELTSATRAG